MFVSHIVYASKVATDIDDAQLRAIQNSAIRNNSPREVTGLLLYGRRRFIQLLEGEWDSVEAIFEKIQADERHTDIDILYCGHGKTRLFPTWSMGVVSLDHSDLDIDIRLLWEKLDVAQAVKEGRPEPFYQLFEMFQRNVTEIPIPA